MWAKNREKKEDGAQGRRFLSMKENVETVRELNGEAVKFLDDSHQGLKI